MLLDRRMRRRWCNRYFDTCISAEKRVVNDDTLRHEDCSAIKAVECHERGSRQKQLLVKLLCTHLFLGTPHTKTIHQHFLIEYFVRFFVKQQKSGNSTPQIVSWWPRARLRCWQACRRWLFRSVPPKKVVTVELCQSVLVVRFTSQLQLLSSFPTVLNSHEPLFFLFKIDEKERGRRIIIRNATLIMFS